MFGHTRASTRGDQNDIVQLKIRIADFKDLDAVAVEREVPGIGSNWRTLAIKPVSNVSDLLGFFNVSRTVANGEMVRDAVSTEPVYACFPERVLNLQCRPA